MAENTLKGIDGKRIRRQYFNIPLIYLYSLMFVIPYAIFVISACTGRFNAAAWPSTIWISIWVGFCFSLPLLILRTLNRHFFGRIICVLTEEGIHYPTGKIRWETIEKIEYAIDTKPRYKSDTKKAYRVIIYTHGGKHILLPNTPLYMISQIKKYNKDIDVKISGITSLLSLVLIMAGIFLLCPFYIVLLMNAPGGISEAQIGTILAIYIMLGIIVTFIFDSYAISYHFWRRILPKKWLSYIILCCYYSSYFVVMLLLAYFPNWFMVVVLGIYIGIVRPPFPSTRSSTDYRNRFTYEQLYDIYINNAHLWEKNLEKKKEKRMKRKAKKSI